MRRLLAAAPSSAQSGDARVFLEMIALAPKVPGSKATHSDIDDVLKDPNFVPALMARAALLTERGKSQGAIEIYKTVLHRFPDFAPTQKHLAALTSEQSRSAMKLMTSPSRRAKGYPKIPNSPKLLAKLSYERSQFAYAIQLFQQSAAAGSLDAEDLYYFGDVSFKRERYPPS
jgi:tetratricopeptide (TPR) repeat protein